MKTIYVFSGCTMKRKDNTIAYKTGDTTKYLPVTQIRDIKVFGNVTLNNRFLNFLSDNEIPVHFYNYYGYYTGTFYPREHLNSGYLILKQATYYNDEKKRMEIAKYFIYGAANNMIGVLNYYKSRKKPVGGVINKIVELEREIKNMENINTLLGIEGNIRQKYYEAFDKITENAEFEFNSRSKKPPKNKMNTLISFGNSLMYTTVLTELYKTHLDARIGYLHETNFRRFSLNLDIAEIFKPVIVDRTIFNLVNTRKISPKHFTEKLGGVFLNENGAKIFLEEYEKHLETTVKVESIKRNASYKGIIRMEAYKIERHLIDGESLKAYKM